MGSAGGTKGKGKFEQLLGSWSTSLSVSICVLIISVVALILVSSELGARILGLNAVPYLATTLVIIFGATTLVAILYIGTIMFSRLKLTDREEALGLPKGSVRALIALILIIIFAIMVIFMYSDMSVKPLTYENGTVMSYPNGTIIWRPQPYEFQIDFGKQVLTTISTLVVAIVGFYFGTKAAKPEKALEETPNLLINPSGSLQLAKNGTLIIKVKTTPDDEKVNWNIDPPTKGSIVLEGDDYKFTPLGASKEDIIKLKCSLAKHPKIAQQLEIKITEEKKKTPGE
jgi:hypothetical protein